MRQPAPRPISGHVFKRKGKRGAVWYAKYRLPDGRQQKKRLGPAWTEKTAPPDGYFTKGKAQAHLDELLRQARDGSLPGIVKTGKTFADATEEWLDLLRERPRLQAVDDARLPQHGPRPRPRVRQAQDRDDHDRGHRPLDQRLRRLEPDAAEVPRLPRLDLQAGDEGLRPAAQPRRSGRAPARAPRGEDRRAAPRGGLGAGQGGGVRPGRRDLPHRRLRRAADGGAARAALARRRFHPPHDPRPRELDPGRDDDAEGRDRARGADGRGGRRTTGATRPARRTSPPRTISSSARRAAGTSATSPSRSATAPRCGRRACARTSASTTCATPSAAP